MRVATSLAVLGGPELAGLSIRPVFAGGTETEDCLRAAVDAAGPAARTSLMSGLKRATSAAAPPAAEVPAATPALPPAPHLTPAPVPTSAPREVAEEEPEPGDEEMEAEELGSQESLAALNFGGVGRPPQQSTTSVSVAAGAAGSITESTGASQASLSAGRPASSSGAVASVALSQASSSPVTSTTRTTPRAAVRIRRTWGDEVTPQHDAEGRKKRRLGLEREVERRRARLAANAAAEEEALRRLSQRYPGTVEEGVLLKKGNVHTCRQHARTRCEDCALTSTPLNECCAEHHGVEGDTSEVRIDFCSAHRWTSCGDCAGGEPQCHVLLHTTPRVQAARITHVRGVSGEREVGCGNATAPLLQARASLPRRRKTITEAPHVTVSTGAVHVSRLVRSQGCQTGWACSLLCQCHPPRRRNR